MKLDNIKNIMLKCQKCELYKTNINYVFGNGSDTAKIMFIGEAPGFNESKQGLPFVGKAGKILNDLLKSVEIPRESVYICNILCCRPPNNRDPLPNEIKTCTLFLNMQIEAIKPKIICTLGNYSTKFIMEKFGLQSKIEGISKLHGKVFNIKTLFMSAKLIPAYHPAGATYNPEMKKVMMEDIKIIKKEYNGA